MSRIEDIRRVINDFNQRLISEMYLPLNDLYEDLGLEHTELGDEFGWNLDFGLVEVSFSSKIASDGRPVLF